jgi:hypothetical protein
VPVPSRSAPDISQLADACLGFLAENPEELLNFMQHAGLDPQSFRASVGTERMQHGLIDYFAANEPILLALCANAGMAPETFMRVWHRINRTE